ncbi:MAG: hypothetical protein L0Y38_00355, partial [Methylococcaceae bacterium]|nr:hypothetical protein [Methylococcaceae bacterium]
MSDAANRLGFDDADGETSESCDIFRSMALANAAAIFIEIPVDDLMATVFDAPVSAVVVKNPSGNSLIFCFASDAMGELVTSLSAFLMQRDAFDHEWLADVRRIQVIVEVCSDPDITGFDASVVGR